MGCAGNIGLKEEKVFKTLLVLDSIRGEHSTGIASINMNKEVNIAKCVGDPYQLFDTRDSEFIFRQGNRVLIGHNRFATTGKISRKNAHPFDFDTLVGCHNGTLINKHLIPDSNKFDVDSEALFNHIKDKGVVEAISHTQGAWALVWYDKIAESINFLRNKERTLFACYNETKDTIFWASEIWMLHAALSRNDIKFEKVFYFSEDKHYEIKINFEKRSLYELTEEECPGKKDSVVIHYPSQKKTGDFTRGTTTAKQIKADDSYLGSINKYKIFGFGKDNQGAEYLYLRDEDNEGARFLTRLYLHKQDELKQKIGYSFLGSVVGIKKEGAALVYKVSAIGPFTEEAPAPEVKDRKGNVITEEEHLKKYHTCCWCSSPLAWKEEGIVYIENTTGAVCKSCAEDPTVASFL